ncbi:MAG: hypothetical protein PWR27_1486 [Petroclostridium sp.]|jgi:hypothetical protein|uniref:hypothetical protein n=1 Tax=Petroclostridium xylanilyticum TaxID=1792311 RepID=UPI000B982727|nr:hypothetical protein [Petroclostridium xylanilyticum]MDK2810777.1 hypothetical protein [Petroclostridium sp.]
MKAILEGIDKELRIAKQEQEKVRAYHEGKLEETKEVKVLKEVKKIIRLIKSGNVEKALARIEELKYECGGECDKVEKLKKLEEYLKYIQYIRGRFLTPVVQ